jgi:serine/threonine protein phosphatase 1
MNYPGIGENEVVYAVGDVHGCLDLLDDLLRRIDADKAKRPEARHMEVHLGDYIDRGADSAGVLARLQDRMERTDLVCLLGNHEAMLLDALDGTLPVENWLANGGDATLRSYRIDEDRPGAYSRAALFRLPPDDIRFLRELQLSFRRSPYLFVHAGIRPGVPLEQQHPHDMVWIREDFLDFEGPLGAVVVHGHTPVEEVEFRRNRIGIDTGAVRTGRLTCLRIDRAGVSVL